MLLTFISEFFIVLGKFFTVKWQGDDKNIERKCDRMSPHFAATDFCALLSRRALMAHIPVVFLVITKLIAFSKGYILCGTKRSPKMNGDKNNNLFSMVLRSFN